MKKTIQWHSTLDVLKNPPSGYQSQSVDLIAGLDALEQNASNEHFVSQFDFDTTINAPTAHILLTGNFQFPDTFAIGFRVKRRNRTPENLYLG
ncbi:unnamed protein product [Penicillium pancosmium]